MNAKPSLPHSLCASRPSRGPGLLLLMLAIGCAPTGDEAAEVEAIVAVDPTLEAFVDSLPDAETEELDREMALTLVSMPLSCLDRPHAAPRDRRSYLDTIVSKRVDGYERNRSFYGCWDWHSAVNSTWAMVRIYKDDPDIPVGGLIDEKLADHLSESAIEGELEFFEGNRTFERPYGWGWLLKLHAELSSWDHPDAPEWTERIAPLVQLFKDRTSDWLEDLRVPSRSGAHSNTAFALAMMLDASRSVGDQTFAREIEEAAMRLFGEDFDCPTAYEPWGSDFLSPCLEEAALMAAVLEPEPFRTWLDDFLPPVNSRSFRPLLSPTDPDDVVDAIDNDASDASARGMGDGTQAAEEAGGVEADVEQDEARAAELRYLASASHLIGLAFIRGDAMNRIAAVLPPEDARVDAFHKLARVHASQGFGAMFEADYAGSHWIGTFALKYLLSEPTPGA